MSTWHTGPVAGWLLGALLSACGGLAIDVPGDGGSGVVGVGGGSAVPDGGSTAGTSPYDSGSAVDAGAGDGAWWEDGGICSMPVGSFALGCPMALTPMCPWKIGEMSFGGLLCDLPFDLGPGVDPEWLAYVDVQFGTSWDDGARLLRVAGPSDCNQTGNGWYFDNPTQPTTIHICPNACACAKTQSGSFSIAQGCWTNAAPGVLDAEIACPHCAKSRPPSCGTSSGGYGLGLVKCEFPLDPSFDPALSNLEYLQHGAVAGPAEPWDGYLTFVPSLADCDKVEEGWTLDSSTTPPTVLVCPSACSCAKVMGASLFMESGCPRHEWKGP